MASYAHDVPRFYQGEAGAVVRQVLRAHLATVWPDLRRLHVLGLGFVAPYLDLWRDDAATCIGARLDSAGDASPVEAQAVFAGDALPLPDLSIDRLLLVHGLERASNAARLLRECWRVLRDDGRLLVVVPNRLGLWAHAEQTPFGEGQPYTQGQVAELFGHAMFAVERSRHALFVPPVRLRAVLRSAALAERFGRRCVPGLGGVIVAEAVKDVYAAAPLHAVARRRFVVASPLVASSRLGVAPGLGATARAALMRAA